MSIKNFKKICPKCDSEFDVFDKWYKKKTFCSRKCANTRPCSENVKIKLRSFALKNPKGWAADSKYFGSERDLTKWIINNCPTCNKQFEMLKSNPRKFCSPNCVKVGGYRKNSGIGKSGNYKGFYLHSRYELAYVIYCLDHNIDIKRFKGFYNYYNPVLDKHARYFPDFEIDNDIIEIKGYKTYIDELKINSVTDKKIKILYGRDLLKEFFYVEEKTGLKVGKNLEELYE